MKRANAIFGIILVHCALVACAMIGPAIYGFYLGDAETGRTFFQISLIILLAVGLIYFAARDNLNFAIGGPEISISLPIIFLALPVLCSWPEFELSSSSNASQFYLPYVSSLTTTALPFAYDAAPNPVIVFWHAIIAWMGGFLMWSIAWLIAFPDATIKTQSAFFRQQNQGAMGLGEQWYVKARKLTPLYLILTAVLAMSLNFMGLGFVASLHVAMGVLSTTAPQVALTGDVNLIWMEALICLFLIFAVSRRFFENGLDTQSRQVFRSNSEIHLAVVLVFLSALMMPWPSGATDVLIKLWGQLFTGFSFLTTLGQTSVFLEPNNFPNLSGFQLYLLGVALIGGGVGTTAGGVKLMRVTQLLKNCDTEMNVMLSPSQVSKSDGLQAGERYDRAIFAWTIFMAVAISVAMLWAVLAMVGFDWDTALSLTVASISNTGPVAALTGTEVDAAALPTIATLGLAVCMVFGRIELLILISVLRLVLWRNN